MSTQMSVLQGAQVPAAFHSLMQQMQNSELSQNVGANYAVVSFKGKVFRVKYGGTETPLTINHQGTEYAAPFMDVVIPLANPQLSKTYYPTGYAEGSDDAPTCWSEDGINPLAPLEQRPKDINGNPVVDCRNCPMNAFGSKINEVTGAKGKACADTRKLIVIPVRGDGSIDHENLKFGGPMLMRVPAASLSVFAEYDRKLQGMGIPYFAVVTRMQFDQSVAYPKFQLSPLRVITDAEANEILQIRNGPQVQAILSGGHTGGDAAQLPAPQQAAPQATPVQQQAPATAAPVQQAPIQQAAPVQQAPIQQAPVQQAPIQQAPVQQAPIQQAAPAFEAPPQAAPTQAPQQAAPAFEAPQQAAPQQAPVQSIQTTEPPQFPPQFPQQAPQQAAPQAFPGFAAPAQAAPQQAPQQAAPAQQAAPVEETVSADLLGRIDQLLDS